MECLGWKQAVVPKDRYKKIQPDTRPQGCCKWGWGSFSSSSYWPNNPISTREADYFHHSTTSPLRIFRPCEGHSLQHYGNIKKECVFFAYEVSFISALWMVSSESRKILHSIYYAHVCR